MHVRHSYRGNFEVCDRSATSPLEVRHFIVEAYVVPVDRTMKQQEKDTNSSASERWRLDTRDGCKPEISQLANS